MGTRRLEVVISGDSKSLSRAFGQTSRDLDQLDGRAKRTGRNLAGFGATLLRGGAVAGITALAGATVIGTRELLAQEKASARTRNVLETMGAGAGVTAKEVEDLASAIQDETGSADDAIQASQNLLLTFKNIKDEDGPRNTFERATRAANDMSVALGTDLESTTIQLGKALNEPAKGALALARSGSIARSDLEKLQDMAEAGVPIWEQQNYLLNALERQFKGAASSEGEATEALQQFQRGFEDASEGLAAKLLPVVLSTVETFRRYWPQIQAVTESAFRGAQRIAQSVMGWFESNILPTIQAIVSGARRWWTIYGDGVTQAFNLAREVVQRTMTNIREVIELVLAVIRGDWGEAWQSLKTIVSNTAAGMLSILRGLPRIVLSIALNVGKAILRGVVNGVTGLAASLSSKVTGAIRGLGGAVATAAAELGVKFANAVVAGAGNLAGRLLSLIPGVGSASGPNDGGRQRPGSGEETIANRQTLDAITSGGVVVGGNRRGALPGSALDLQRARSANSRSEGEARRTSEESYIRTRLANIAGLQSKLDTAYRRIEDAIKGEKASRSKIKVPRAAGPKRRKALQGRADITQRIRDLQDELETIWQEYADLGVEAADLGGELSVLQRSGNEDAPTAADFADAQAALAALTADPADDIAAAINQQTAAGHALNAAIAGGDPRQIESAARAFAQARDNLARLQLEATQANTAAVEANTEATKQSFGGSVAFGFRGQMEVLRSLAMPSSDRLTGAEVGI